MAAVDLTKVAPEQRLERLLNAQPGETFIERCYAGGYVDTLDGHPPGAGLIEYRTASTSNGYQRRLELLEWRIRQMDRLEWLSRGGR
jgi:hypothetical protein